MIARIYDRNNVSLSTYIDFKDRTLQEIRDWFLANFAADLEEIEYIYSLLDDKYYRWGDLAEITIQ